MVKPAAGEVMLVLSAVVIRGNKSPLLVDSTSSMADGAGFEPDVEALIFTCPKEAEDAASSSAKNIFFMCL